MPTDPIDPQRLWRGLVLIIAALLAWWYWDIPRLSGSLESLRALATALTILAFVALWAKRISDVDEISLITRLRRRAQGFQTASLALFVVAAGVLVTGGFLYLEIADILQDESVASAEKQLGVESSQIELNRKGFELAKRRRDKGAEIRDEARVKVREMDRALDVARSEWTEFTEKFDRSQEFDRIIGELLAKEQLATNEREAVEKWLRARKKVMTAEQAYIATADPSEERRYMREASAAKKEVQGYESEITRRLTKRAEELIKELIDVQRTRVDEAQDRHKEAEQVLEAREKNLAELDSRLMMEEIGVTVDGEASPKIAALPVNPEVRPLIADPSFQLTITRIGISVFTLILVQTIVSLQRYMARLAVYYNARADIITLLMAGDDPGTRLRSALGYSAQLDTRETAQQLALLDSFNPRHITFSRETSLPSATVDVFKTAIDALAGKRAPPPGPA